MHGPMKVKPKNILPLNYRPEGHGRTTGRPMAGLETGWEDGLK